MSAATCSATTAKGKPCKRPRAEGLDVCSQHAGPEPESLLTDEVADRFVELVAGGNREEVAARAAGVAPRTMRRWLLRGTSEAAADSRYRVLRGRVEQARAEGEAHHVARVLAAGEEDWRASAWFLERAFPERWGKVSVRPYVMPPEPDANEPGAPAAAQSSSSPPEPDVLAEVDELAARRAQR